jgi:hypothetical protein
MDKFSFLFKLSYYISQCSGFLFISLSFDDFEPKLIKSRWNIVFFTISLGLSFYANFYIGHFPVAEVARSQILEFGVNFMVTLMLMVFCVIKIAAFSQKSKYFYTVSNLYKINLKVD